MNMLVAILLIGAVAALALALRAFGGRNESAAQPAADRGYEDPVDDADDDLDDLETEDGMVEAAAITSDGWAFVPRGTGVELVPPGEDDDLLSDQAQRHGADALKKAMSIAPINPATGKRLVFWKPGESLAAGDLIAARVVRGAPDVDPWRVEALGRDYDYRSYAFETEEAARFALALLEERIARLPRDSHGTDIPVGAEDFTVARRKHAETEQALAMDSDEELEK
jgi:hypothetical protein